MGLRLSGLYSNNKDTISQIIIEKITKFKGNDLNDLCDATEAVMHGTIGFTIGFNRIEQNDRLQLENYFNGVLLVPERELIVGRFDGIIAGSIQLIKPTPNDHTSSFAANVDNHFVAPWARGFGLAKALLVRAEDEAKNQGFSTIRLSVRSNSKAAIKLYESRGYEKWGTLAKYETLNGEYLAGHFYNKDI
jgi:ribosomal protein S18 acetylase RimI-like enzyme